MAIPETVIEGLGLEPLKIELGFREQAWRILYTSPELREFLTEIVRGDPPTRWEADLTPKEQLFDLFRTFIVGEKLRSDEQFHVMRPDEHAVWELKTPDLRIFGWFLAQDQFAGIYGNWAEDVKAHGLYPGYRDEIVRRRRDCGAENSNCVWEIDYDAVVSIRN